MREKNEPTDEELAAAFAKAKLRVARQEKLIPPNCVTATYRALIAGGKATKNGFVVLNGKKSNG